MTSFPYDVQTLVASGSWKHMLLAALSASSDVSQTRPSSHRETSVLNPDIADIRASRHGDNEAYARLIKRYQDQITARMWKFTRDRGDCEELVHEVFVQTFFSLSRYRERHLFPNWLNRIATRVGYHYWKQQRRHGQMVSLDDQIDMASWSAQDSSPDQTADQLHDLLAQLAPRDRLVLTLLYWDGCNVADVAQQTGWSKTMVKVQAHRARKRLRRLLEKE